MAKQYKVVGTTLKVGEGDQVRFVEPGEIVTGLTVPQMKELWDAGVLEEAGEAPAEAKSSAGTETVKAPASGSQTPSEGGDEDKA
jgi:hypothetical protein